jgi:hypothetical protein
MVHPLSWLSGCAKWQERADCRKGGGFGIKATPAYLDDWLRDGWDGPHFEVWQCNRCFERSFGKEELGRHLLAFWKRLVKFETSTFNNLLVIGWYAVDAIEGATGKKHSWAQIVKMDDVFSQLLRRIPTGSEVANMDVVQRRHYYGILKRWLDKLDDPATVLDDVMDRHWFRRWPSEYEIVERRIEKLETCTKTLEANPGKLVEFALNGYASLV